MGQNPEIEIENPRMSLLDSNGSGDRQPIADREAVHHLLLNGEDTASLPSRSYKTLILYKFSQDSHKKLSGGTPKLNICKS